MKRFLAFLLAALLAASVFTACEAAEKVTETDLPDTAVAETSAPETELVTVDYPTDRITENGTAMAHIVVAENASQSELFAAEELVYHIKKVSGADVAVVNEAGAESLPILIGTPASMPELETLFPDDLTWLRDLGEGTTRWGDDGFAIRQRNGKLYIFGATERGALNGVYDFMEENLGVLWIRRSEDTGLIYDEMPTITVAKADYREKSPFQVRGVSRYGADSDSAATSLFQTRNRFNCGAAHAGVWVDALNWETAVGLEPFISNHNMKWWLTVSPTYDAGITEYWETREDGTPLTYESSRQVNYWSELTADTIAASVIHQLDLYGESLGLRHVGVCMEDLGFVSGVYPEMTEPFEYAPGQFVEPTDEDYLSTVYFTFINRIARQVKEKHPEAMVNTYAYTFAETTPRCEIEDNVIAVYCHYCEDLSRETLDDIVGEEPQRNYDHFTAWVEKTPNVVNYNYYGCCFVGGWYERPYWYRMQNDLQYYAEHGLVGMTPAIYNDDPTPFTLFRGDWGFTHNNIWEMNILTGWLYSKLAWNPYEDVDALIVEFCDKVYGEASEEMQEYYRLIRLGWVEGALGLEVQFNSVYKFSFGSTAHFDNFIDIEVDGVGLLDAIQEALDKAWEAADDRAKEHIRRPRECFADCESFLVG